MTESIRFARLSYGNIGFLINQMEILSIEPYSQANITPPSSTMPFRVYRHPLYEGIVLLPIEDLLENLTLESISESKCILIVSFKFPEIVSELCGDGLVDGKYIGIIWDHTFESFPMNPDGIKLFTSGIRSRLAQNGILGVSFLPQMLLYWLDLKNLISSFPGRR
ncbi:MAG: hypothetical protein H7A24_04760 [Leptospiraceae bacterium]|nr:hypothetical protein [Leptospiraceae bacterium]MCP5511168.1 hypothetical protein [Leptospiraceae bacterium]